MHEAALRHPPSQIPISRDHPARNTQIHSSRSPGPKDTLCSHVEEVPQGCASPESSAKTEDRRAAHYEPQQPDHAEKRQRTFRRDYVLRFEVYPGMHTSLPFSLHCPLANYLPQRTYSLLRIATLPAFHVLEILFLGLDIEFNGHGDGYHRHAILLALLQPLGSRRLGPINAIHLDAAVTLLALSSNLALR